MVKISVLFSLSASMAATFFLIFSDKRQTIHLLRSIFHPLEFISPMLFVTLGSAQKILILWITRLFICYGGSGFLLPFSEAKPSPVFNSVYFWFCHIISFLHKYIVFLSYTSGFYVLIRKGVLTTKWKKKKPLMFSHMHLCFIILCSNFSSILSVRCCVALHINSDCFFFHVAISLT